MKLENNLGTDPIRPLVLRIAIPSMLAQFVSVLYSIVDRMYIGNIPEIGDMVLFGDMAIYTTCKNNTFNGMPLPDIWKRGRDGTLSRIASFGYDDFKMRLGNI